MYVCMVMYPHEFHEAFSSAIVHVRGLVKMWGNKKCGGTLQDFNVKGDRSLIVIPPPPNPY